MAATAQIQKDIGTSQKPRMGPVIKKIWPNILSDVSRALAYTWAAVNFFIVSQIIHWNSRQSNPF